MSIFAPKATLFIAMWIKTNKYQRRLARAENINGFKKIIKEILFKDQDPDERFIAGAKIISWGVLFQTIKNL